MRAASVPAKRLWCSRSPQARLAVASRVEPGAVLEQGASGAFPKGAHVAVDQGLGNELFRKEPLRAEGNGARLPRG